MKTPERHAESTTAEDAIIGKSSRVVEEVIIGKEVAARRSKALGTALRTEVEVDDIWPFCYKNQESQSGKVAQEEGQMNIDPMIQASLEYKGYQALVDRAVDVFGDELVASRWLSTPSNDLNGDVPLHVAQKLRYEPAKVEKVFEPIFMQIEHGIYS